MKEIVLFQQFAKGSTKQTIKTNRCVIYTRVSTKEQADNNLSLDTQKKACEKFAAKNNLETLGYFGGTYESAKTDERKEFNNMLSFVKRSKERISYIVVYSVDRFSRSGANAIYIASQLKRQGIIVFSVTQPIDASTTSGSLQQNIQFIFSQYENEQRREKCMAGMKEMLERGDWCTMPPMGYDIVKSNGKRKIVINSKGKLIRKAFYWKAEKISSEEIMRRLAVEGLKMSNQTISGVFRNPFYCGLIAHGLLEGRIIKGNQEKLISEELFLEVNGVLASSRNNHPISPENDEIPLKQFLKCEECGRYLRGYKAYKNQKYYYKCNTKGCNCNKRADSLNDEFRKLIGAYTINLDEATKYLIKKEMTASYNEQNEESEATAQAIEKQIAEVGKKIDRLEERYVLEEITKEMYDKFLQKFREERRQMELEMGKQSQRVSNLEECIESAFVLSSKLATVWDLGGYSEKQALQYLVFPEGIAYNRKNDRCRTLKVNGVFSYIAGLARDLGDKKSGNDNKIIPFPPLVV